MEKGDSILFKASNGMKLFEIVEKERTKYFIIDFIINKRRNC